LNYYKIIVLIYLKIVLEPRYNYHIFKNLSFELDISVIYIVPVFDTREDVT